MQLFFTHGVVCLFFHNRTWVKQVHKWADIRKDLHSQNLLYKSPIAHFRLEKSKASTSATIFNICTTSQKYDCDSETKGSVPNRPLPAAPSWTSRNTRVALKRPRLHHQSEAKMIISHFDLFMFSLTLCHCWYYSPLIKVIINMLGSSTNIASVEPRIFPGAEIGMLRVVLKVGQMGGRWCTDEKKLLNGASLIWIREKERRKHTFEKRKERDGKRMFEHMWLFNIQAKCRPLLWIGVLFEALITLAGPSCCFETTLEGKAN